MTLQQTSTLAHYGLAAALVSGKLVCFRNETGHVLASQSGLAACMELSKDGITSSATSAKASSTVELFVSLFLLSITLAFFFDILQSCTLSIRYKSAHAVLSYRRRPNGDHQGQSAVHHCKPGRLYSSRRKHGPAYQDAGKIVCPGQQG